MYNDIDTDGFIEADRLSLYNNAELASKENVDRFMQLIKKIKYNSKSTSMNIRKKYDACMEKITKLSKNAKYTTIMNEAVKQLIKDNFGKDISTINEINKYDKLKKKIQPVPPVQTVQAVETIHATPVVTATPQPATPRGISAGYVKKGGNKPDADEIVNKLKHSQTTLKKVIYDKKLEVDDKIDILEKLLNEPAVLSDDKGRKYDEEYLKQLIDVLKHEKKVGITGNINVIFDENNKYIVPKDSNDKQHLHDYINNSRPDYDDTFQEKIKKINKLKTKLDEDTHPNLDDLRNAYYDAKYSEYVEGIKINREDVIIFVLVTFVIRMSSLFMLKWMLDINMITTLEEALLVFAGFYTILFLLLLTLVNVETKDITNTKSYLYFFYMKSNDDHTRLIVHAVVFGLLILIPFIISEEERKKYMYDTADPIEKRSIYKTISAFSLLMWLLLSIVSFILV